MIHIDIVKPNMTSESVSLYRLLRGMRAPNTHKRFVVHGLRIDADACHRVADESCAASAHPAYPAVRLQP